MKSLVIGQDQDGRFVPTRTEITEYDELNSALGGWIEAVPTNATVTIWCNEEGKLKGLPYNDPAMELWKRVDEFGCIPAGDYVAGPIVVQGPVDDEGEATDCPDWVFEMFGV